MNQKQIDILKQNLTIKDGQPVTTSFKIAESFDREHRTVLQAIREMECTDTFREQNFLQTVHLRPSPLNGAPIESPYYEVAKKGFLFLAMGFTGKKAALLREAYIEAFEQMEQALQISVPALKEALLQSNPLWADIRRYHNMGLRQFEIAKLVERSKDTVRVHTRRMAALGLLEPVSRSHAGAWERSVGVERQLPLLPEEVAQ